jgi:hypothetical protein
VNVRPVVMNYTPVDYASRVLVTAVAQGETGYFHLRHPQPVRLDDLLAVLGRELGLPATSYPTFWAALRDLADAGADEDVLGTLAVIPRADGAESEAGSRLAELFSDDLSLGRAPRTDRLMAKAGLSWPVLGDDIFRRYAAFHQRATLSRDAVP